MLTPPHIQSVWQTQNTTSSNKMENFQFRPLTLTDIADEIGENSPDLSMATDEDGTVTICTPNLTVTNRAKLKALFVQKGMREIPATPGPPGPPGPPVAAASTGRKPRTHTRRAPEPK